MESEFSNLIKKLGMIGGDDSDDSDDLSTSQNSSNYEKKERRPYSEAKYVLPIGCIIVKQKRNDDKVKIDYHTRVCKEPKINFKFFDNEIKYALIVKGAMKYVNGFMSMNDVEEVVITIGKKETKMDGDKLGETVNIEKLGEIDEISIILK
jgi:hypothetical protein